MFGYLKYFIASLVLCTCVWTIQANAATITVSSCSYADVSNAVNAASSGDTVSVPAGSCTWSSTLLIRKGIILRGAGIDSTIVTWGGGSGYTVQYQPSLPALNETFRITGFTLDGNNITGSGGVEIANMSETYLIDQVRIDHNKIANCKAYAVKFIGLDYGLIDNNEITNNLRDFRILGRDNYSWNFPLETGSSKYIYIEDNNISRTGETELVSGWGARWVFRYNTLDLTGTGYNILDIHGNLLNGGDPQGIRGIVGTEIYGNTLTNANRGALRFVDIRGGTNIVFDNKISGTISGCNLTIVTREEDDNSGTGYPIKTDYPGYDPVKDTYLWDNTHNGNPMCFDNVDNALMIKEKRDYWSDVKQGNGGATDYFSTGLSLNRPATCADDDVYWETDTKKLYRCEGANNWIFIYKPYTYPHPLRIAPSAPNLK